MPATSTIALASPGAKNCGVNIAAARLRQTAIGTAIVAAETNCVSRVRPLIGRGMDGSIMR